MILEPIMMNAGIIVPEDGYLAGLKDLLHAHGALMTFDEVKTGLTVGPGGASRLLGVTPDLICVAKAVGGGLSTAAIGGSTEVMGLIARGEYEQVGTFNGNPLAMAAARAMLTEVLDDAAYAHLDAPPRPDARRPAGRRRPARRAVARGDGRRQGLRVVPAPPDPQLPRLPRARRPLRPRPLAGPAQPRRLPPALGQGRAVADLGAAHRADVDRFVANCGDLADAVLGTPA